MLTEQEFSRNIIAFGGGTGLSHMAKGFVSLNEHEKITLVPSVWDDGGSTRRLRDERGNLPMGDMRQCLVASIQDPIKADIVRVWFDDRLSFYDDPKLKDHSLGNLNFSHFERMYHGPDRGLEKLKYLLDVKVNLLYHSFMDLTLCSNNTFSETNGESNIDRRSENSAYTEDDRIKSIRFNYEPDVNPEVPEKVSEADEIIFAPGDLWTSVLGHTLFEGTRQAILASEAPIIYCLNLMTKPGETNDYSALNHIESFLGMLYKWDSERFTSDRLIYVIANDNGISEEEREHYLKADQEVVMMNDIEQKKCEELSPGIVVKRLSGLAKPYPKQHLLRHDPDKLARTILELPKFKFASLYREKILPQLAV